MTGAPPQSEMHSSTQASVAPCALRRLAEESCLQYFEFGEGALIVLRGAALAWGDADIDAIAGDLAKTENAAFISLQIEAPLIPGDWIGRLAGLQQALDRTRIDILLDERTTLYPQNQAQAAAKDDLLKATAAMAQTGAKVRWLAPLTSPFIYRFEGFFSVARALGVEPIIAGGDMASLGANDRLFVDDFVRYRVLGDDRKLLSRGQAKYYAALLDSLSDASVHDELPLACALAATKENGGADGAGGNASFLIEAAGVLTDGVRGHAAALTAAFSPKMDIRDRRFRKVLLIGAYGGEHIGDAAILGGVVFRLHKKHGVSEAILMSQRPDHTRHLIPMIETPAVISVREYLHREIDACIDEVDAVIFAGGPLIDLPKQLVRHLYAASLAKRKGKPFLMEGIGPGPFHRLPSIVTARRLVKMADFISLRTRDSADEKMVCDIECEIGRDPAFDYLDTRQGALTKVAPGENQQIEQLLDGTGGRPVIGVNIRPIYHHYTAGVSDGDKASHTRDIEDRFERRLAEAINKLDRRAEVKPAFIFFPMNAVQFGLSDMTSAYRISRHIAPGVDWRVWEADASLDGVLALIRRLDAAVTMRFHATIFALSQRVEAIGVDYRIGKRDKVAAVLSDVGKGDQCARIDELTPQWLIGQLSRVIRLRD